MQGKKQKMEEGLGFLLDLVTDILMGYLKGGGEREWSLLRKRQKETAYLPLC